MEAANNKTFKENLSKIADKDFAAKVKGAKELISIVASGVILAMITPRIVNKIVHPVIDKITAKKR